MSGVRKGPSHPHREGARYLNRLSKAALLDLVLDGMDLAHGSEDWTVQELADYVAPRLLARRDRLPPA